MAAIDKTLADLKTPYVDLFLVHWPYVIAKGSAFPAPLELRKGYDPEHYLAVWRVLEQAVDQGKLKAIGTSNMSATKLKTLMASARIMVLYPLLLGTLILPLASREPDREPSILHSERSHCMECQARNCYHWYSSLPSKMINLFRHAKVLQHPPRYMIFSDHNPPSLFASWIAITAGSARYA